MTLEEAIKHCEEVAEKYCEKVEEGLTADDFCDSCASEHRQLAEWLRELKAYQEAMIKIPNASVDVNLGQIPINNRSYEDITKCLMLAYEQGVTDTISRIEKYVKRDQMHDPLIDEVVKSGAPFKKWLESFNTESASVCFNKIQELKGIVGAGSEKNTQGVYDGHITS